MVFLLMNQKKFSIVTFGCQMNVHDSEKIAGVLYREGYGPAEDSKDSDLIVFNTCSIREKAEQKFFSELGRMKALKKKRPDLKIAVAGCIAQQMGEKIMKRAPHVDYILGPQNIGLLGELVGGSLKTAISENLHIAEWDLPVRRATKGRAWITIMYGCNNFCSYCVVPYTRGREKSRPSKNILTEIRDLEEEGFVEVTLLGQNVNSYRSDMDFPGLLRAINSVEAIRRIRFVTSHPRDLSDELISEMEGLEKVCEHIHLPLQSGSDRILRMMNRGYTYDEYRRRIDRLRSKIPGISITTDIIAGFPGEDDDDHSLTTYALNEIGFDGIFAFKYSPRDGTKAATMKEMVAEDTKSERLSEILRMQDHITLNINKKLEHSLQEVLVEGVSETNAGMLAGRTRTNKIVNFEGNDSLPGRFITLRVLKAMKHSLIGEVV
ncbi:MAG TPA: tRNA (N6-isopentenyl adenosine(37)-C2)-methylthiotransferase MiaB [Thermodesulfovibrionales bacterium]|nr:tRNA (N6-isopentenyl adenosine(37)-C2)-methylthiotransferase MiaB [Thermodesulfovibrionales bacterium]